MRVSAKERGRSQILLTRCIGSIEGLGLLRSRFDSCRLDQIWVVVYVLLPYEQFQGGRVVMSRTVNAQANVKVGVGSIPTPGAKL